MDMDLALFDFDGTITNKAMYTEFIRFAIDRRRLLAGKTVLAPVILANKAGLLPDSRTREIVSGFAFWGRATADLESKGAEYAAKVIPARLRKKAMSRIQWHRYRGDCIVVVSASLNLYSKHWCRRHHLDLICTEMATRNGHITGRYACGGGDCSAWEKARRIRKRYNLACYETIYAYGDTTEDHDMLDMADIQYMQWERVG